ncbi:MAG: hypothetical protein AAFU80_03670 [Pseudomonadota bacterium]
MVRFIYSTAAYLLANSVGLLLAVLLLPNFTIDPLSFVIAVAIFSVVQTVAGPMITKLSLKQMPQLMGGVALVVVLLGLLITDLFMPAMQIGGIANLLAATLLVWIGSLVASILIPIYVIKQLGENVKQNRAELAESTARANEAASRAEAAAKAAESANRKS